jgi:hypothetical protein
MRMRKEDAAFWWKKSTKERRRTRDDVAGDNLNLGKRLLDVVDHVNLKDAVALGRVKHNDVHARVGEHLQTLVVGFAGANGSTDFEKFEKRGR